MDSHFFTIALNAFKSNIKGLPSFCRLTMLELLSSCNMTTGVITIDSLEELARDAFQVTPAPGRKKEDINGDTLRNALRSIKKAKPDCFIFSVVNQNIVIEMPFMRELYEQFYGKTQEVAGGLAVELARPISNASIDDSLGFTTELTAKDAGDVAAASFGSIRDINNKINKTKHTNSTGDDNHQVLAEKQPIAANFYPNAETIAEAQLRGFTNVAEPKELAAFIRHNQQSQTQWADFNPVYLTWLERASEYQQRKQATAQMRSKRYGYFGNQTRQQTELDIVNEANRDAITPSGLPYGYTIDDGAGVEPACRVGIPSADELISAALREQEWRERQRHVA